MWGKKRRFGRKLTDFRPNVGVKSIDLGEKRQYTYHRRQRGYARIAEDAIEKCMRGCTDIHQPQRHSYAHAEEKT